MLPYLKIRVPKATAGPPPVPQRLTSWLHAAWLLADSIGRFATLDTPLVVDLHDTRAGHRNTVDRLIAEFAKRCKERNIEWVLVAKTGTGSLSDVESVQRAASVADALEHFVRVISARRHLPLHRLRTPPPPESGLPPLRTGS